MRHHPSRRSGVSPLLFGAVVAAVATLAALGPAAAAYAEDPTPSTSAGASEPGGVTNIGPATAGEPACTVTNSALNQISGMVATAKGIVVVEAGDVEEPSTIKLYTLDGACKSGTPKTIFQNPIDPEDIALGSGGFLWIGDIGDNKEDRERIALWKVPADLSKATIYRFVYPSGGKFDAEALLMDGEDKPIIITKTGAVYHLTTAMVPNTTSNLPVLEKVGDFKPQRTGTENPFQSPGQTIVTGAAKSPDGSKVVIRTYSDAYEFDVAGGDIAAAITSGAFRVTPLPNEPQGEAITYSADGKQFLTLSQKPQGSSENPKLLKYTPFVPTAAEPTGNPADNLPASPGAGQSWWKKLTFSDLTRIVAAVGVVGLVLAISGIVGIRRARRRRREEEEYDDYDDYDDEPPGRGRRGRGRVDQHGFGSLRDPQYQDGYDPYGDNGFAGNGASGAGYADSGYGAGRGGATYGANAYGAEQYGADQYGADQYPGQQYGGGQQYGAEQYGGQQYGGQQYGADQYGGQQYGGDQYGGQQYGADAYGQQHEAGAGYGQPGGQAYPGYGYEDDFDPLQDPRRR